MARTRVFISSTCFDLNAVREHLCTAILSLGHEPKASDHAPFGIAPELSTVENCRRAVREQCDVFVLIVGGCRGSSDPATLKSVVNVEYLEAKRRGLDILVFVKKTVWSLMPIFRSNPAADLKPVVDHPEVMKFIQDLQDDSRWIFQFDRTEEIVSALSLQLSSLFGSLLGARREGRLTIPRDFLNEPQSITAIILDRPPYWEFMLACELLERSAASASRRLDEINRRLIFRKSEHLDDAEALTRLQELFSTLESILFACEPTSEALTAAFGPRGSPGDPVAIKRECERFESILHALLDWEIEVRSLKCSEPYQRLFASLQGTTQTSFDEMLKVPRQLRETLTLVQRSNEAGPKTIELTFTLKPEFGNFMAELEALRIQQKR